MAVEDAPQTSRLRKRILVVDDHADNVEVLRARLDAKGYEVSTASGGEEALQAVAAAAPDLILLDVMMPHVDGKEVARRIKSDHRLPFIPIIMQTALDSTQDRVEGLDAGADDYITKPINFSELEARIRSMLRIKALQDDLEQRERELEDMNDRLRKMAQTDGLTEVDNRRYLEERLQEMIEHSTRLQEPLACVMCDIDHFKSVNDTYGHQAGDAVLKEFAGLLRDHAREIDRVGRYGGEEFVILLPGTLLDEGVTFAERLRHAVEMHIFRIAGATVKRTMSCGVAAWPHTDIRTEDDLLRAADDALYAAKELGRNRVVRFAGDEFNALIGEWKANVEAVADRPADSRPSTPSRGSTTAPV
ncbi:MAG TPA: diguanylate cyclase [Gemmatimonadaceae bacterium]|nr:diguanylate cyclase [Gemmatimonadaceae bacterium]